MDTRGNLFIADTSYGFDSHGQVNNHDGFVVEVTPDGSLTLVAGFDSVAFLANGGDSTTLINPVIPGPATNVYLNPHGVAV